MQRIFQSLRKVGIALLALACVSSVFTIGRTNAGFSDTEISEGNRWEAGSLDMEATYVEHFNVTGMNPSQFPDGRITVTNVGLLDYRYNVKFHKTGGDLHLCQNLHLVARRDGSTEYEGALADFELLGGLFTQTPFDENNWDFTITLPADAGSDLENLSCQWSFDFQAWQTSLPNAAQGFHDEESVTPNSVATGEWLTPGDVVINEVMWMGSSVSSADEWIELKNMTGKAISLANWQLENAGSSPSTLTIPAGKSISANGYFLIANYAKTDSNSALNVSAQWVTTNLSLNNSSNGNIILKAPTSPLTMDSALGEMAWPAGNDGTLKQSMERNDISGDGLVAGNWHTCVSGAANSLPYWDTPGVNFGTPLAANLSPIVMNEFVPNPIGDDDADKPDGEWIELYNILSDPIDVADWYFTNHDGHVITVTADRTKEGTTVVPGKGTLVVYLNDSFLDNDQDTISLFAPHDLDIPEDDVREDIVSYQDAHTFAEGKSFARFPDGEGIWVDPQATPGEDNTMNDTERDQYRVEAYETCFDGSKLLAGAANNLCSPLFLRYLGLLHDLDSDSIRDSMLSDILDKVVAAEKAKLMDLINEDGVVTPEEKALATIPDDVETPTSDTGEDDASDTASDDKSSSDTAAIPEMPTPAPTGTGNVFPVPTDVLSTPTEDASITPAEAPAPVTDIPSTETLSSDTDTPNTQTTTP